ncbi:hypothetical protein [Paenibacillus eucommiae]|uniref:Uncharacterized protein n=1 Tax=Paenibacillus eucommiae TaxID=1355755 RepID=A0ABS4JA48_9BACL|nr:hypothetical protein [Paenibacillus eucommiae]MBP1996130.1 hypothetical protein [Paenibacillus eucommiae]
MNSRNIFSTILLVIGGLEILVAFIIGIAWGQPESNYGAHNWSITLWWWIGGFISGMVFIGFSEVIHLLQKIYDKIPAGNAGNQSNTHTFSATNKVESMTTNSIEHSQVEEVEVDEKEKALVSAKQFNGLTIKIGEQKFSGYFLISELQIEIYKKAFAEPPKLMKTVSLQDINGVSKNGEYLIVEVNENETISHFSFKTHTVFDYQKIADLLTMKSK